MWGWDLVENELSSTRVSHGRLVRSSPAPPRSSSGPYSRPSASGAASSKACAPLRKDAPGRRPYARGALPALSTEADRRAALKELEDDFFAASARKPMESRLNTIERALGWWDMSLLSITRASILALGATLKKGGVQVC